jgi:glycosyltransferase involved in cell wall biosynthesis
MKKLISVIIPAYNEEDCVNELALRLKQLFDVESNYNFEVVIVENGSLDSTWELLRDIATNDNRFKVVKLSRNFRMDGGLTAGLEFISGDACVLMTADLQDPPELISDFLRHWELGWENIYGIVTKRTGTSLVRRFNSRAFYWLAGRLTDGRIPQNASDFRLVDKKVYLVVRGMQERNRFVRGLFAWSGFRSIGIPMIRPERFGGVSNAPTLKVLDLAFKGIFAHSYKPLRLITILGGVIFMGTALSFILLVYKWITEGVPFPGYGLAVSISLLALGLFGLMLGIMSEYLGLVYEEVKSRPNYLVSETINLNS